VIDDLDPTERYDRQSGKRKSSLVAAMQQPTTETLHNRLRDREAEARDRRTRRLAERVSHQPGGEDRLARVNRIGRL